MALFNKKNEEKDQADKPAETQSTKDLYQATPTKSGRGVKARKVSPEKLNQAARVLVRPMVTEKGTELNASGKYLFAVAMTANKIEVAKAVENLYGVKPVKVNIIKMEGKRKGQKISGRRKDWKKAVVSLPKGKTIDVYEGV